MFVRPNGTGSNEGQAIFKPNGDLVIAGSLIAGGTSSTQKILWQGVNLMSSGSITLSEAVSKQNSGIVLVFSRYNTSSGTADNGNYNHFFVPKLFVSEMPSGGSCFTMRTVDGSYLASKYVYINDTYIAGNAYNASAAVDNSWNNVAYCLRMVIGV